MIQHMNLVFRADGLNTGEFAFLMACCNHTDDRGYVIASMQQLADEAHMKMTAAKANKQRLIQRGLLASKERYSPKNGARIADLYRVNLKLLAEMKRERVDYGPTLVEELSFAAPQETPSSDPRSESDPTPRRNPTPPGRNPTPPPPESDGGVGSESDPLLLPSSSPSSLSGVPADADVPPSTGPDDGEREAASQADDTPGHPEALGETSEADKVMDAYIAAYMTTAGLPPRPDAVRAVRTAAEALLSVGRSVGNLCVLASEMGAKGWVDLVKHAQMNPEAAARPARDSKPWCGECNYGIEPTFPAGRMRENAAGRMEKCHCHPGHVPPQPVHA